MRKLLLISCAVLSLGVVHAQSKIIGTYDSQAKYNRLPMPPATATTNGSVKIGSGIAVTADGTISVSDGGSSYVLPPATTTVLGGIKAGTGLDIATDGTVSITSFLPLAGGTMTGPTTYVGQFGQITPFYKLQNNYGDTLNLGVDEGQYDTNALVLDGTNHRPAIQFKDNSYGLMNAILLDDDGNVHLPSVTVFDSDVQIAGGKALTFHSTNSSATSSYIFGDTDGAATVSGTLKSAAINTTFTGTGNGYACINASGVLYRSATACN